MNENFGSAIKKALGDWLRHVSTHQKEPTKHAPAKQAAQVKPKIDSPASPPVASDKLSGKQSKTITRDASGSVKNVLSGGISNKPIHSVHDEKTGYKVNYYHARDEKGRGWHTPSGKPIPYGIQIKDNKAHGHPKDVSSHGFEHATKNWSDEDHLHAISMWHTAALTAMSGDSRVHHAKDQMKVSNPADPSSSASFPVSKVVSWKKRDANETHRKMKNFKTPDVAHTVRGESTVKPVPGMVNLGPTGEANWPSSKKKPDPRVRGDALHDVIGAGKGYHMFTGDKNVNAEKAHAALWHAVQHGKMIEQSHAKNKTLMTNKKERKRMPEPIAEKHYKSWLIQAVSLMKSNKDVRVAVYKPQRSPRSTQYMRVAPGSVTTHSGETSRERMTQKQGRKTISQREAHGAGDTYHPHLNAAHSMIENIKSVMRRPKVHETHAISMTPDKRHDPDNVLNAKPIHGEAESGGVVSAELHAGVYKPPSKKRAERQARKEAFEGSHFSNLPHSIDVGELAGASPKRMQSAVNQAKESESARSYSKMPHDLFDDPHDIEPHGEGRGHRKKIKMENDDEHFADTYTWSATDRFKSAVKDLIQKSLHEEVWSKPVGDVSHVAEGHKTRSSGDVKYHFKEAAKTVNAKPIYEVHGETSHEGKNVSLGPTKHFHIKHSDVHGHPDLHGSYMAEDHADAMVHHVQQLARRAKVFEHSGYMDKDKWEHHKNHLISHHGELTSNPKYAVGITSLRGIDIDKPIHDIHEWEGKNSHAFKKVKKALSAGYGYAGAPGQMSGGSSLMVEDLEKKPKYLMGKSCGLCKSTTPHYGDTCLKCKFQRGWSDADEEGVRREMAKKALNYMLGISLIKGANPADVVEIFEQKVLTKIMKGPKKGAITVGKTKSGQAIRMLHNYGHVTEDTPENETINTRHFNFFKQHSGMNDVDHHESAEFHIKNAMKHHAIDNKVAHIVRDMHMHHALEHIASVGDQSKVKSTHKKYSDLFDKFYMKEHDKK